MTEFEFTPTVDLLDHFSSRTGVKTRDRRVATQKTAALRIVMDEWTGKNAAMMLMATEAAAVNLSTTADTNSDTTLTNLASTTGLVIGRQYNVSGTGIPAGTKFTYDGASAGTLSQAATATAVGVAVVFTLQPAFDILSLSEVKGAIRFEGTNDIGPRIEMIFPNVTFTPSSGINPISDEWGTMEVTGDVLASATGSFGTFVWNTGVI